MINRETIKKLETLERSLDTGIKIYISSDDNPLPDDVKDNPDVIHIDLSEVWGHPKRYWKDEDLVKDGVSTPTKNIKKDG